MLYIIALNYLMISNICNKSYKLEILHYETQHKKSNYECFRTSPVDIEGKRGSLHKIEKAVL
jgi:hypothetical protein